MADPMTLAEYARSVNTNYHTLYARVKRRVNRGTTEGIVVRKRGGRLLMLTSDLWEKLTAPLPRGRPKGGWSR